MFEKLEVESVGTGSQKYHGQSENSSDFQDGTKRVSKNLRAL